MSDFNATNPQQPFVGPSIPATYKPPVPVVPQQNTQQQQVISNAFTAAGVQPLQPTQTIAPIGPETRSEQQIRNDIRATVEANRRDIEKQKTMGDYVWIKKNNQWKGLPTTNYLGTNLIEPVEPMMQVAAIASGLNNLMNEPFDWMKAHAGKQVGQKASATFAYVPFSNVISDFGQESLKSTQWLAQKVYDYAAKPLIRDAATIAMAPLQIMENLAMFGGAMVASIPDFSIGDYNFGAAWEPPDAGFWEQLGGIVNNTTLAQRIQLKDPGSGLLPGGEMEQARNKLEEKLRPELWGKTATFGRTLAGLGVVSNLFEAGDDNYAFWSGILDAGFQIYADPINIISHVPPGLQSVDVAPTALATTGKVRQLQRLGIAITPDIAADANKVDELLAQAEQLSADALDIITPRQGVVWSGDRYASAGPVKDQFYDVGDPLSMRNHGNLFGQGLYVTDDPRIASSYSSGLQSDEVIHAAGDQISFPTLSQEDGVSRVYKFEIPQENFNLLNAELPWTVDPNVPWNFESLVNDFGVTPENAQIFAERLREAGFDVTINEEKAGMFQKLVEDLRSHESGTALPGEGEYTVTQLWKKFHSQLDERFISYNQHLAGSTDIQNILRSRALEPNYKSQIVSEMLQSETVQAKATKLWAFEEGGQAYIHNPIGVQVGELIGRGIEGRRIGAYATDPLSYVGEYKDVLKNAIDGAESVVDKETLSALLQRAETLEKKLNSIGDNFAQRTTLSKSQYDAYLTTDKSGRTYRSNPTATPQYSQEFSSKLKELDEVIKEMNQLHVDSVSPKLEVGAWLQKDAFGGFQNPSEQFVSQIEPLLGISSQTWSKQVPLGDIGPYKGVSLYYDRTHIPYVKYESLDMPSIPYQAADGNIINDWLKAKGVDAIWHTGGVRRGGYGTHNAYAVLSPSKMTMVEKATGEALAVNRAKKLIDEGKDLHVAATDIASANGFQEAHGFMENVQQRINPSMYDSWEASGSGQNIIRSLVNTTDPFAIWAGPLKGRSPRLAVKLADATTEAEITQIMRQSVMSIDPFEHLWALPGWSGNYASEAGYRIKGAVSEYSRIAATLPRTAALPLDDFAVGAKHVDDVLQVLNTPLEKRASLMNEYLRIVSQDDFSKVRGDLFDYASRFKQIAIRDRVQPIIDNLREVGLKTFAEMGPVERITFKRRLEVADELDKFITEQVGRWSQLENKVTYYTIDSLGRQRPLKWLDGNGFGPLYPSQQINSSISLLDPSELDEMVKLTGRLAEYRTLAKTLPLGKQAEQALDFGRYWARLGSTVWKKSALLAGRYVARVVPEEMMRVTLSGQFSPYELSYVSEVLSGRLNKNIYGEMMPYIGEAQDLAINVENAEIYARRVEEFTAAGNTRLANKYQKQLDKLDVAGNEARLAEVERLLEEKGASVLDVMIGVKPDMAADTVLGQNIPGFIRKDVQQVVRRDENGGLWLRGVAEQAVLRSENISARWVSDAVLSGDGNSFERIAQYLVDQSGSTTDPIRKAFEQYFNAEGKMKPGYNWDSIEGARDYVNAIKDDIIDATGGHRDLLAAIRDRTITVDGEVFNVGKRTAEGAIPSKEFTRFLREGSGKDPMVPAFVNYDKAPEFSVVYPAVNTRQQAEAREVFKWFMQNAYGRSSDKFARIPMWNARKWNLIADMAPLLDSSEAKILRDSIGTYNLPLAVEQNVLDNLTRARGTATLKDLDQLAGYKATEDTIALLFDARKRSLFGKQHWMLFPFFDAFREVGAQVMKTAINPYAIHRLDKASQALRNFQVGGPGQTNLVGPGDVDSDGKKEGFFYKDPVTNQQVWNIPLVGGVAKALSGVDFNFKISAGSMTMMTSVIPSAGPYASIAYSAIPNRNGEFWDKMNKLIIPFGELTDKDLTSYFVPISLRRLAQGATNKLGVGEQANNLLGDPNSSDVFKLMQNRILQTKLGSGKYEQTEDGVKQAMIDSQNTANVLWGFRGAVQFFAPAAPISEFYVKAADKVISSEKGQQTAGYKLIALGVFLESMRNVQNSVRDAGGDFNQQMEAVVNRFGDNVIPYMAALTDISMPGAEPSKAFYKFKNENQELFNKYPDIAGYFAPHTNEYDQGISDIFRRANQSNVKSLDEVAKEIQQLFGDFRMTQEEKKNTDVYGASAMTKYANSISQQQIKQELPGWSPDLGYFNYKDNIINSINSVFKAAEDPMIQKLDLYPALKEYMGVRSVISLAITSSSRLANADSWKSNQGGIGQREFLKSEAMRIAEANPAFKPLWDNILSKEFKTLTLQEQTMLKAGQLP
jgi:hypothetical protein